MFVEANAESYAPSPSHCPFIPVSPLCAQVGHPVSTHSSLQSVINRFKVNKQQDFGGEAVRVSARLVCNSGSLA